MIKYKKPRQGNEPCSIRSVIIMSKPLPEATPHSSRSARIFSKVIRILKVMKSKQTNSSITGIAQVDALINFEVWKYYIGQCNNRINRLKRCIGCCTRKVYIHKCPCCGYDYCYKCFEKESPIHYW